MSEANDAKAPPPLDALTIQAYYTMRLAGSAGVKGAAAR